MDCYKRSGGPNHDLSKLSGDNRYRRIWAAKLGSAFILGKRTKDLIRLGATNCFFENAKKLNVDISDVIIGNFPRAL